MAGERTAYALQGLGSILSRMQDREDRKKRQEYLDELRRKEKQERQDKIDQTRIGLMDARKSYDESGREKELLSEQQIEAEGMTGEGGGSSYPISGVLRRYKAPQEKKTLGGLSAELAGNEKLSRLNADDLNKIASMAMDKEQGASRIDELMAMEKLKQQGKQDYLNQLYSFKNEDAAAARSAKEGEADKRHKNRMAEIKLQNERVRSGSSKKDIKDVTDSELLAVLTAKEDSKKEATSFGESAELQAAYVRSFGKDGINADVELRKRYDIDPSTAVGIRSNILKLKDQGHDDTNVLKWIIETYKIPRGSKKLKFVSSMLNDVYGGN